MGFVVDGSPPTPILAGCSPTVLSPPKPETMAKTDPKKEKLLIQVLKKTAETRSEISWNGRPYSTIRAPVGSGIYFYAVEGKSGASLGKIQTGTFVMIR